MTNNTETIERMIERYVNRDIADEAGKELAELKQIISIESSRRQSLEQQIDLYRAQIQRLTDMVDEGIRNFRELNKVYNGDSDTEDYGKYAVRVKSGDIA